MSRRQQAQPSGPVSTIVAELAAVAESYLRLLKAAEPQTPQRGRRRG